MARCTCDRERNDLAGADHLARRQKRRHGQRNVIADDFVHAGVGRGHVLDVDACPAFEALEDELSERAGTRRCRGQRLGTGECHELRDRFDAERSAGHEHEAVGRLHGDVSKILKRIVADIGVDCRAGQVRARAGIDEGVAVGLGARDLG
jgi:hypothetical protein